MWLLDVTSEIGLTIVKKGIFVLPNGKKEVPLQRFKTITPYFI